MRLAELLEQEAQAAALTADALSPGEAVTSADYVDAFWGPAGARMAAAQALMGSLGDEVAYGRSSSFGGADDSDGVYADRVERDERVHIAMQLMVQHEVPFAIEPGASGGRITHVDLEADALAFYNLLDHRLAFSLRTPPYDLGGLRGTGSFLPSASPEVEHRAEMSSAVFFAYGTNPIALTDSPLRHFYGIEPSHVSGALAMMRNLLDTRDVEYRAHMQVTGPPESLYAIQPMTDLPRDPRPLAAAMQNVGAVGDDVFADALAVLPGHGAESNHIYSYDPDMAPELGGALALHVLRVHLARLDSAGALDAWLPTSSDALSDAFALATSYVGDTWVEYKRHQDYACVGSALDVLCPGHPACDPMSAAGFLCPVVGSRDAPALAGVAHVDVYFDPSRTELLRDADGDGTEEGSVVYVRSRGDAACLLNGHRADGSDEGCGSVTRTALVEARLSDWEERPTAISRIGYEQRRFLLANPDAFAAPSVTSNRDANAYLLYRTGLATDPEESVRYIFLDVVQPRRRASVHALGGRFMEMFAEASATDPTNPGRPLISALGVAYDFVPPLEHELISDGDGLEDSYQTYLTNASSAAAAASQQLRAARTFEQAERLDDRADAALLAEAEVSEEETVSQSCGSAGGCDLTRRPAITLGNIFIDGEALVTLPVADASEIPGFDELTPDGQIRLLLDEGDGVADTATTCAEHLAGFNRNFTLSGRDKHNWNEYTEAYLSAGLGCARFALLTAAYFSELHEVPEVVLTELAAGGSGEFSESNGAVRDALIGMHARILELRESLRAFESTYTGALAAVHTGALQIDMSIPSGEEAFLCHLSNALAIAGAALAVAASVVVSVVSFGAGAAVVAAVVLAIAAGVASSASAGVNWAASECEGDTRPAQAVARTTFANAVVAIDNLRGVLDRIKLAVGNIAIGDAQVDRLQRASEIAALRRAIRAEVAMSNSVSDLPEWHVLQSYRVARARQSLFRAQQYAFVARRSVEYRFGLDMASMTRGEPFVDAPTLWANDLFELDTATTAVDGDGTIHHQNTSAEAIEDWVGNLSDFVRGYPFVRRFRDATDTQIVRVENLGLDSRTTPESAPLYERMMFKCRDVDSLIPAGEPFPTDSTTPWPSGPPCADLGGVEYAEIPFVIPAQLSGYLARRLADGSYNYRHEQVAFNVVGSPVIDCRSAIRPWECYGDGNLQYSLRQDGLVFVENYEYEVHSFLAEPGVILEGRALAAERALTNPLSAADQTLVSPFERRELWGRPLSGRYTIRILGRPEVLWENIESLQMLLRYRYWTRQE